MRSDVVMAGWMVVMLGTGCTSSTGGTGTSSGGGPTNTRVDSNGVVVVDGTPHAWRVDAQQTQLLLLNLKMDSSGCTFFHNHAVAALSANYRFLLDPASPQTSNLTATVAVNGLDVDRAEYRAVFPETQDSSFTDRERQDIRTNMMDQLAADRFPTITFSTLNISSLSGPVTAQVAVDLKGRQSTMELRGTAVMTSGMLVLDGEGTLDSGAHDMPVGPFQDCINPNLRLRMHLVLRPGEQSNTLDASVEGMDAGLHFFPDDAPCGEVGFEDVKQTLLVRCAGCHGDPPSHGATVRLTQWEDFRINTRLSGALPLYLDTAERLEDTGLRKMPPAGSTPLTAQEQARVLAWARGGGHRGTCLGDGGVAQPVDAGTTSTPADAGPPPACGEVGWQDVWPILDNRCVSCHGNTSTDGQLNTYASGFVPTHHAAYAGQNRWQSSYARMVDQSMPSPAMPNAPVTPVPAPELDVMRRWVAAGLPEARCSPDGGVLAVPDAGPPALTCGTGRHWLLGDLKTGLMHPGKSCIACHQMHNGAPHFTVAGTVNQLRHDEDDCGGLSGVTVTITGADNRVKTLTTNFTGNFYTEDPIALPYKASITRNGVTTPMTHEQMDGDCMSCHTALGAHDAPGRIWPQ